MGSPTWAAGTLNPCGSGGSVAIDRAPVSAWIVWIFRVVMLTSSKTPPWRGFTLNNQRIFISGVGRDGTCSKEVAGRLLLVNNAPASAIYFLDYVSPLVTIFMYHRLLQRIMNDQRRRDFEATTENWLDAIKLFEITNRDIASINGKCRARSRTFFKQGMRI